MKKLLITFGISLSALLISSCSKVENEDEKYFHYEFVDIIEENKYLISKIDFESEEDNLFYYLYENGELNLMFSRDDVRYEQSSDYSSTHLVTEENIYFYSLKFDNDIKKYVLFIDTYNLASSEVQHKKIEQNFVDGSFLSCINSDNVYIEYDEIIDNKKKRTIAKVEPSGEMTEIKSSFIHQSINVSYDNIITKQVNSATNDVKYIIDKPNSTSIEKTFNVKKINNFSLSLDEDFVYTISEEYSSSTTKLVVDTFNYNDFTSNSSFEITGNYHPFVSSNEMYFTNIDDNALYQVNEDKNGLNKIIDFDSEISSVFGEYESNVFLNDVEDELVVYSSLDLGVFVVYNFETDTVVDKVQV